MNIKNRKTTDTSIERNQWISILAQSEPEDLENAKNQLSEPINYSYVSKPEIGMIMTKARSDASGPEFNFGEIAVTRCMVQIGENHIGYSCILGSNKAHAELAALFDGLLQIPEYNSIFMKTLIPKLKSNQLDKDAKIRRNVEKTRVEFFTLKRGE